MQLLTAMAFFELLELNGMGASSSSGLQRQISRRSMLQVRPLVSRIGYTSSSNGIP